MTAPRSIVVAPPASEPTFALDPSELHLWWVDPTTLGAPELLARYETLLSEDERRKRAALVLESGRHEQLVTRALVRTLLARYLGVGAAALRFADNRWGRPELAWPPGAPLAFNVAHARGLIVCLVAARADAADGLSPASAPLAVGVDVENVARRHAPLDVAEHFFAPAEIAALHALAPARRPRRFFELWTLKESYIKARGMGLALPLDGFAFDLEGGSDIALGARPDVDGAPEEWCFRLLEPTAEHLVAVAVRAARARTFALRVTHGVPLAPDGPLADAAT